MGKRQKRFSGKELTSDELLQKEVNIVMTDGGVYHLKVLKFSSDALSAEDMRKKEHQIPLKKIYEIVLDVVSAY